MKIDKKIIDNIKITPLIDTLKMDDIDDNVYFGKEYKHYLSNSRLGLLKTKGAEAFFNGLKSEYNPSFTFGSNLHALVLEPEKYELIDSVIKPTAKAGLVADFLYNSDGTPVKDDDIKIAAIKCNYYKDKLTSKRIQDFKVKAEPYWRDRFLYEKEHPKAEKIRIYTDEKSINILKSCLHSIEENTNFKRLLKPTYIVDPPITKFEHTILIDIKVEIPDYEPAVYSWKSKLDNFSIDIEENKIIVNDLKTTSRLAKDFDLEYFSYERELAIYSWLLNLCANKFYNLNNPKMEGNFLVVSTIPDFNTAIYPMTKKLYKKGFEEFKYLLKCVAYLNIVKGMELK